jgi:hypothetical protein
MIMAFGIAGGGRTNPPTQPTRPLASSSSGPPTCDPHQARPTCPGLALRRTPGTSCRPCGLLTEAPAQPRTRKDAGPRRWPTRPPRPAPTTVPAKGTHHDQPRPVKEHPSARSLYLPCLSEVRSAQPARCCMETCRLAHPSLQNVGGVPTTTTPPGADRPGSHGRLSKRWSVTGRPASNRPSAPTGVPHSRFHTLTSG